MQAVIVVEVQLNLLNGIVVLIKNYVLFVVAPLNVIARLNWKEVIQPKVFDLVFELSEEEVIFAYFL